ncbi:MAG: integrin alpha, partial [Planctomycetota bacterium JB042]
MRSVIAWALGCVLVGPVAGAQTWSFHGAKAYEKFGHAVAAAGDLDNDGFADFVVGFPGDIDGSATVSIPCGVRGYSGMDGSLVLKVDHTDPTDWYGFAVAAAGDVDQDGHDDLAVGAPNDSIGFSFLSGRVYVIAGKTGKQLHTIDGTATAEQLGWSLTAVGDLDQDGLAELAIGAPGAAGTVANAGAVRVHRGANGAAWSKVLGSVAGGRFGSSVALAGDVDQDGGPDLVIGAPFASGGAGTTGMAFVHGATGAGILKVSGAAVDDRFGAAVAGIGDVNGDGVPDLAAGAPGSDAAALDAGAVLLFDGKDGSTILSVPGASAGDAFGQALAAAGDVNADGIPDLLAGAPGGAWAGVVSGSNGLPIHAWTGAADFGAAVADLGDVDQDGQRDVLVGAPGDANAFGLPTGSAHVFPETPIASILDLDDDDDLTLAYAPGGPLPADVVRLVSNAGVGPLNWSVSFSGAPAWASATPPSGTSNEGAAGVPVTLSFDPAGLAEGTHSTVVTFQNDDVLSDRIDVDVELQIGEPATDPILCVDGPTSVHVDHGAGMPPPDDVVFTLSNCGNVGAPLGWSVEVIGDVVGPVTAAPATGTIAPGGGPAAVTVAVDPSGLGSGIHQGALRFLQDGVPVATVPVTLTVELASFDVGDALLGHADGGIDAAVFGGLEKSRLKLKVVPLEGDLRLRVTVIDALNQPVATFKTKAGKKAKK